MKLLLVFIFLFPVIVVGKVDEFAFRELHVFFQKADHNHDRYLDKQELGQFVDRFMKRLPGIINGVQASKDAIEGGKVLSDELFNRFDKDKDGKLSFRGSLLRKSEATNFSNMLEKVLINLVHEISNKRPPFPEVNPFASDGRKKRNADTPPTISS
uniref:EF-hand domain-containing protein n=1 Tax=Panagrolaimus sp. JU765 TaxID=591449 RepID=A0AC34QTT4_9BILA